MNSTSIPRQLAVFTVVLAGAMGVGSLVAYLMLDRAYDQFGQSAGKGVAELARTYAVLERVTTAQDSLQRLVRLKDPDKLEAALAEIAANRKEILELTQSVGEGGAPIRAQYERAIAAGSEVADAVLKGDVSAANERFMDTASPRYTAVKAAVRDYFAATQQTTLANMAGNQKQAQRQTFAYLLCGALALCVLLAYLWRVRARISVHLGALSTTLLDSGGQLANTSAQVTASSQAVSEGVNRQAAALEETSASLEEIGATASQNANHAQQAKGLATEARSAAETGHRDMREMMDAMDAIKSASGAIAGIIKTIDEIAFQTNLLALNAAVEAARAGQAGLGFAVVADEVRALAQRSAMAARETASSVEQVITKSDRGVEVCGKVAHSLEEIVARVRRVDTLVAHIAAASDQQRSGIEEVSAAMSDMEKVTQSGAATAEETAATVLELNAQAEALRGVVEELKRLAGDARSAHVATSDMPRVAFKPSALPRRAA